MMNAVYQDTLNVCHVSRPVPQLFLHFSPGSGLLCGDRKSLTQEYQDDTDMDYCNRIDCFISHSRSGTQLQFY